MGYTTEVVENLLRNYYTLQQHPDSTFSFYKNLYLRNRLTIIRKSCNSSLGPVN